MFCTPSKCSCHHTFGGISNLGVELEFGVKGRRSDPEVFNAGREVHRVKEVGCGSIRGESGGSYHGDHEPVYATTSISTIIPGT